MSMPDSQSLLGHWGYLAIFAVVLLGNLGIPVPEEPILVLAGYLTWEGKLHLISVLGVGIASVSLGDNTGYWIGRLYGRQALERYGRRFFITPRRLESMHRFISRYGTLGIFLGRFLPGIRFLAGPVAGTAQMPYAPFFTTNLLGAVVYVPIVVAMGYAIGYGFEDYLDPFERVLGKVEHVVLIMIVLSAIAALGWRALRARGAWSRFDR